MSFLLLLCCQLLESFQPPPDPNITCGVPISIDVNTARNVGALENSAPTQVAIVAETSATNLGCVLLGHPINPARFDGRLSTVVYQPLPKQTMAQQQALALVVLGQRSGPLCLDHSFDVHTRQHHHVKGTQNGGRDTVELFTVHFQLI